MKDIIINQTVIDGRIFYFTKQSLKNDLIAFYIDETGAVNEVFKKSIYGAILIEKVRSNKS